MNRGIRKAKTTKQVKTGSTKGLGKAVVQIVGIGLVAGTALVLGTDKVMKKIFKKDECDCDCGDDCGCECDGTCECDAE
jgi:hypothetical protein